MPPPREYDVAAADDLPDGAMRPVEADGEKLLLIRKGEAVHAIGAVCPHAGAPLAEGVRHGDLIVCPWHKATFCARTGAVLEPPAVDPLPRFDARIEAGRVLVRRHEDPPRAAPARDERCFVIIGAGAAGAMAAQTLREAGFAGRVVMLDGANRVPYDRTLLSKYFLSGETGAEKTPLQSQAWYAQHKIERRTATVTRLDAATRRIDSADGGTLHYDAALIATGGVPTMPEIPGATDKGVFLLRSRADAEAILAAAERGARAVVLGAGFIGMEVAAALRERGLEVTVVGRESAPFEKQLGAKVGGAFTALHETRGVRFRLGCAVERLRAGEVVLQGGEVLPADLTVIGCGVRPATGFVAGVALGEDGGIAVDAGLRAADWLYAAGDVARFPLQGDGAPVRVEHWRVAEQHGRIAALNMLGGTARCDAVPVFWTIQYMKRLDYVGHAEHWDDVVLRGDLEKPAFLAYYVRDGRVVAAAGMDRDRDTAALIELFNLRRAWTADALGDSPAALLASIDQNPSRIGSR